MAHKVNQNEIDQILSELEVGLMPIIKSAKEDAMKKLSKSGEGPEGSASPGSDAGGSPAPAGGDAPASATAGAPSAPSADPAGAPPDASPSADPAASPDAGGGEMGPADPAELEAAYAQLPVDQLKMHYIAAKSALFQKMGSGGDAGAGGPPPPGGPSTPPPGPAGGPPPPGGPSGPPPGPAGGPPPPPPGASPDPTFKSEIEALKNKLTKSEEASREQEETIGKLAKGLQLLLKPERRAVTGISYIAKSEPKPEDKKDLDVSKLSKNDVTRLLNPRMQDILKKNVPSDLEAIKAYYNGDVDANAIKHLLG